MKQIRVVIADDHKLVREGIKQILSKEKEITIVNEFNNGMDLIEFVKSNLIDVILLDLNMPMLNGFETSKILLKNNKESKIIILSMIDQLNIINRLKDIGIKSYLLKNAFQDELIDAIISVSQGQNYYNKQIAQLLFENPLQKTKRKERSNFIPKLSRREKEILELIAEEYTNKEIAEKLFVSENTVKTHRTNLLEKLNAKNTAGLIKNAINYNFIQI